MVQPPSPTGQFQFSTLFTDLPGEPASGSPLASFLLGQVQTFSIDLQQQEIRNRAHAQEYFVQDAWAWSDRVSVNAGVRYTLNFPSVEANDQAAIFDLEREQIELLGRDGRPRAARRLHWDNVGPRLGLVGRLSDTTVVSAGYGLVWIEMAGITTPFTTPAFPFLQTVTQRTLDNLAPAFVLAGWPERPADPADAVSRTRSGRLCRGPQPRLRLRAAVERGAAASARCAHVRRGGLGRLAHHACRRSRYESQSAQRGTAGAGRGAAAARPESVRRPHPALVVARRPDDPARAASEALSQVHDGQPVSQQRRHHRISRADAQAAAAAERRPRLPGQLHPLTAAGRRLVGVRRIDSDRTGGELSGRRQLQSRQGA